MDMLTEKSMTVDQESEKDFAEARMLLAWARSLPEHRLSLDAWTERELTRAARSA